MPFKNIIILSFPSPAAPPGCTLGPDSRPSNPGGVEWRAKSASSLAGPDIEGVHGPGAAGGPPVS